MQQITNALLIENSGIGKIQAKMRCAFGLKIRRRNIHRITALPTSTSKHEMVSHRMYALAGAQKEIRHVWENVSATHRKQPNAKQTASDSSPQWLKKERFSAEQSSAPSQLNRRTAAPHR